MESKIVRLRVSYVDYQFYLPLVFYWRKPFQRNFLRTEGIGKRSLWAFFTTNDVCDGATLNNNLNHLDVLSSTNVQNGLMHFSFSNYQLELHHRWYRA